MQVRSLRNWASWIAGNGSDIILWDVASHQPLGQLLQDDSEVVTSLAFSPDGKTLATISTDSIVILWDVASHHPIGQSLKGHSDEVSSVAFSPDGNTLASGNADNTVILWDLNPELWAKELASARVALLLVQNGLPISQTTTIAPPILSGRWCLSPQLSQV